MTESTGRTQLLSVLRIGDETVWSVIREVAATPEEDRCQKLRAHAEAGFSSARDQEVMDLRRRFDDALGLLTLYEIGQELGILADSKDLTQPPVDLSDLNILFESGALLRYANAYLYFGIRFLAGRLFPRDWMINPSTCKPAERTSNKQVFALVHPPKIGEPSQTNQALANFLQRQSSPEIEEALNFLDDFVSDGEEPDWLELWLRGLWLEADTDTTERFTKIAGGLSQWALQKSDFYLGLQPPPVAPPASFIKGDEETSSRPAGGWAVTQPIACRFGLADLYWLARLFRADVSASGSVTYKRASWLHLLRLRAEHIGEVVLANSLRRAEEALRSVFDITCDLIQNSIELTAERERQCYEQELFCSLPRETVKWRQAFDEELREIEDQRARRKFRNLPASAGKTSSDSLWDGWSERVKTGKHPRNLMGLAFSGGGIRSATFNLGVLQGLQEFDLLRYVDYLSTVSGGGFIGSWLIANVCRTTHWLGRLTDWDDSIAHLRRYSNYLAPSGGALSADTWTMWGNWIRNAFLIQLTGATWLAVLMLSVLGGQRIFLRLGELPLPYFRHIPAAGALAGVMALFVVLTLLYNLAGKGALQGKRGSLGNWVRRLVVLPSWIGSFFIAALLWGETTGRAPTHHGFAPLSPYSVILMLGVTYWKSLLLCTWLALLVIALATLTLHRLHALWISFVSTAVLYLQLAGIMWLFCRWSQNRGHFDWYAFVFGPTLVLIANTLSVVLFIGFCGRNSSERIREWWTRLGAWLGIYGAVYLGISVSAVFGPLWMMYLFHGAHQSLRWGAILSWIGTVLGGLFAGNSSKTGENGAKSKSPRLDLLAKAGGFLFILGAVLMIASLVYVLLAKIATDYPIGRSTYWYVLHHLPFKIILWTLALALGLGTIFSWFFEINIFGLNQFYRNRLVRCYLGATRWVAGLRKPQPFTGFDEEDDLSLCELKENFRGPFPILNCALNLGGSSDLSLHTRHSASFSLTPLHCGSDRPKVGYAPTRLGPLAFAGGIKLGQAVAISGAAASPNMGYNTSPLVSFLLTMFNVRLGWWFPNPGRKRWHLRGLRFSLYYLLKELLGLADETNLFVNVSDGGHFENLGIYELIRRRCKVIIASDAECDESLQFGSLGNLVRICETDFDAKIEIDVSSIRTQEDGYSRSHCTIGKINYSNGSVGYLIYLKASVTGDEDVGVTQYRSIHSSFPHETTADQFFSESQFESYRRLGYHVVRNALRDIQPASHPVDMAEKLYDVWVPGGCTSDVFIAHTKELDAIWERFRASSDLTLLMSELMGNVPVTRNSLAIPTHQEVCACLELVQLMENVFLDLRLDDFWEKPDNRGWAMLFMAWARSPIFRKVWIQTRHTFGIRFEYFCEERLGLPRDRPIARV